jgi:hypothetical protein
VPDEDEESGSDKKKNKRGALTLVLRLPEAGDNSRLVLRQAASQVCDVESVAARLRDTEDE